MKVTKVTLPKKMRPSTTPIRPSAMFVFSVWVLLTYSDVGYSDHINDLNTAFLCVSGAESFRSLFD